MDARIALFFMTECAGLVMVIGGMWLIYKQKIYIDKESSQPIEVGLPGGFNFKSNYPALALFVLGFFPLIYPFQELSKLVEYPHVVRVKLTGAPNSGVYPALVYASVAPSAVTREGDSFSVPVPFIGDQGGQEYKVLLIAGGQVLDSQTVTREALKPASQDIPIQFTPTVFAPSEFQSLASPAPGGFK